jgi:predicted extracellular nuclease
MKQLFMMLVFLFLLTGAAGAQTADLFISEYVEGSGYNKALEIYNGTSDPIDLGDYVIEIYNNGSTTGSTIALGTVSLVPGDVYVLAHGSADPALLALADQTDSGVNFNGDDAVVLARGMQTIDSIGQVGFDPGSAWTCALGSTVNATLRRMASFCTGDTNPDDVFDPCDTFEFFPSDSFDGLGSHTADCTSVGNGAMSWGSLKASYR